ncbi:uncharacterized protein DCS_02214 [Drechmeria coniospora]|uniref:LysM domain-containing protein n=1 Tax=Drechmeria coniospora TaxID=98403 RepID=A0A151GVJ1_DRECN|nr:uncharacterized protein DCS_02214 [Drechmeria coniospora]KYK61073.1 uncharacterized protein DCS_02214 [Drechmeria coniospora]ODA80840.1 hypothetical protein RJ55_03800 [Drechmeria coniospora]
MSRFSRYDTDDERLPDGMTRVGYDADTQVYTFQDADGSYWESAPGCQYGHLTRVGDGPSDDAADSEPFLVSDGPCEAQERQMSWRHELMPLLNFGLLVGLSLLLLFWYLRWSAQRGDKAAQVKCGVDSDVYTIKIGDTCWAIAKDRGVSVDEILQRNFGLVCASLNVGSRICLPLKPDQGP